MLKFIFCLILTYSPLLSANTFNEENLCEDLFKQKKSIGFHEKIDFVKAGLKLRFQKSKLAHPQVLTVEPGRVVPKPFHSSNEHVIFTLGVREIEEVSQSTLKKELLRLEELTKSIDERRGILKHLIDQNSVQDCRKEQLKHAFSWDEWQSLQKEQSTLFWAKRYNEHVESKKIVTKALHGLKLPWRVIENESLENIYNFLHSTDTRHVILIAHGRDLGEIFDRCDAVCPANLFENLSPTIQSLSFFVCHSEEAIEYYNLEKFLKESKSNYRKRYLFYVNNNEIYGQNNIAPLSVFKYFLHDVDHFLAKNAEDAETLTFNAEDAPVCSLSTKGLHLIAGTVSITLNGHLIGAWEALKFDQVVKFSCSYLKDENKLVFSNARLHEALKFEGDFDVTITSSDGSPMLWNQRKILDDTGSLYRITFKPASKSL
jgi:hypothetical protein